MRSSPQPREGVGPYGSAGCKASKHRSCELRRLYVPDTHWYVRYHSLSTGAALAFMFAFIVTRSFT